MDVDHCILSTRFSVAKLDALGGFPNAHRSFVILGHRVDNGSASMRSSRPIRAAVALVTRRLSRALAPDWAAVIRRRGSRAKLDGSKMSGDLSSLTLEDWTFDLVERLCAVGRVETTHYDFKLGLSHSDGHTKLCCAFANSGGGFVVLGVRNEVPFVPVGMVPDGEIARTFGHRLRADPTVNFEAPKPIEVPGTDRLIYVFHVPRSQSRPHLPTAADKRVFWKRTNTGCEQMTLEEIRAVFLDYEGRRQQLALLAAELFSMQLDLQSLRSIDNGGVPVIRPDANLLNRLLPDVYPLLAGDGEILGLLLSIRGLVKITAGEEELFLGRIAARHEPNPELWYGHRMLMRRRAESGIPIIDATLRLLSERYGVTIPLQYSGPMSEATARVMADINRRLGSKTS